MPAIQIQSLSDPRLHDYVTVKERQLHHDFRPNPSPSGEAEAPYGKFMAEGDVVFHNLLASRYRVLSVLCTPTRFEHLAPHFATLDPATPIFILPAERMLELVGFNLHRGLLAIAARMPPLPLAAALARNAPVLVLEGLTNHDNVGSSFRNAACLGAQSVLLSPGCADPLYRKSVRVSIGHALRLPFARVAPWPHALGELRQFGFTLAALDPGKGAVDLPAFAASRRARSGEPNRRVAFILGTEGPGLSEGAKAAADVLVRVPMSDNVDSLNVSVTSAIALYELNRT